MTSALNKVLHFSITLADLLHFIALWAIQNLASHTRHLADAF